MIKVIIADDHSIVRRGLRELISGCADMQVVAEAEDGHQALRVASNVEAHVIVLDIGMPGPGFLETIRRLHTRQHALAIVVYSMHVDDRYALRAMRAGAAGYVTKCQREDELLSALRHVCCGRRYLSPAVAEGLLDSLDSGDARPDHEALSEREYQVLCLLGRGTPVTRAAAELTLSPKTVSTYRLRVLKKLGLENTAELVRYAVQHGLVA